MSFLIVRFRFLISALEKLIFKEKKQCERDFDLNPNCVRTHGMLEALPVSGIEIGYYACVITWYTVTSELSVVGYGVSQ